MKSNAIVYLELGCEFPYDRVRASARKSASRHWSERAALGILKNLGDRRGIKHAVNDETIDIDVRREIVKKLAEIIRLAQAGEPV